MTLLGFNLHNLDSNANIIPNIYGNMRINISFKTPITESAICCIMGDFNTILGINKSRDEAIIILIKNTYIYEYIYI